MAGIDFLLGNDLAGGQGCCVSSCFRETGRGC